MRPEDLFALSWTLYRLLLSAVETAAAWCWAVMLELWLPRHEVRLRSGPSLAQMVRETRRDTFESDEEGGPA